MAIAQHLYAIPVPMPRRVELVGRPSWQARAACKAMSPKDFIRRHPRPEALAACARCPVSVQCLALALDLPDAVGLWGGTLEADRRAILLGRLPVGRTRRTGVRDPGG